MWMAEDVRGESTPWNDRLQTLIDETVDRSTASTANFGRLLAAATGPGVNPEVWTGGLAPRHAAGPVVVRLRGLDGVVPAIRRVGHRAAGVVGPTARSHARGGRQRAHAIRRHAVLGA